MPDFTGVDEGFAEIPGRPDIVRFTPFSCLVLFDPTITPPIVGTLYDFVQILYPQQPPLVEASHTGAAYCTEVTWPTFQVNVPMLVTIGFKWAVRPQFVPST